MVQTVIKNYNAKGCIASRPRSGLPKKLQRCHERAILRSVNENPKISAPTLATNLLQDYNIEVAPQTVRNSLKKK